MIKDNKGVGQVGVGYLSMFVGFGSEILPYSKRCI